MYVGFRSFLGALVVVGLSLGASFGLGVAVGGKPAPAIAASATSGAATAGAGTGARAAASSTGSPAAAAAGGGAGFGAGGGQAVSGTVESATPTSLVVKSVDGTMVTLVLTPQTLIRKADAGTAEDLKPGVQVLATRDGATNAATVSIVPAGTTLPGAGGPRNGGGGGIPGARGTATP